MTVHVSVAVPTAEYIYDLSSTPYKECILTKKITHPDSTLLYTKINKMSYETQMPTYKANFKVNMSKFNVLIERSCHKEYTKEI
jgi:hypothetical protein